MGRKRMEQKRIKWEMIKMSRMEWKGMKEEGGLEKYKRRSRRRRGGTCPLAAAGPPGITLVMVYGPRTDSCAMTDFDNSSTIIEARSGMQKQDSNRAHANCRMIHQIEARLHKPS